VSPEQVAAWCATTAAAFRTEEHRVVTGLHRDRDAALVEYTLRQLAYAPDSDQVVEAIDRRRAVTRG
jgi:hypothetical protein